jgi:hypothetical protein
MEISVHCWRSTSGPRAPPPPPLLFKNDSPQIGHPQFEQVLKVTGFCSDERAATPIACSPDIGQLLKVAALPGF